MKTKCLICGYDIDGTERVCALCGADPSEPERKLLEAARSSYATADKFTAVRMECYTYLTDRRLIIIPAKLEGYGLSGVLTAAVYNKMTSKSGVLSVPLGEIRNLRDGKFGFVKALIAETNDGDILKFTVPKREEWRSAIQDAMRNTPV